MPRTSNAEAFVFSVGEFFDGIDIDAGVNSPLSDEEVDELHRSSGSFFNRAKATGEWSTFKAKKKELKYAVRRLGGTTA